MDPSHQSSASGSAETTKDSAGHLIGSITVNPPPVSPNLTTSSPECPEDGQTSKSSGEPVDLGNDFSVGLFPTADSNGSTCPGVQFEADITDMELMSGMSVFEFDFPEWTPNFPSLATLPLGMTYGWNDIQIPYSNVEIPADYVPVPDTFSELSQDSDTDASPFADEEGCDNVINEIAQRLGSLQVSEDGELRYFGATSNMTLLDDDSHVGGWPEVDTFRDRGQNLIDSAGLGHSVDSTLQEHLTNLYFTWQDPTFHVVDRGLYKQAQARYERDHVHNTFYSETLVNTM
jgi:hypothetical protein